MYCYGSFCQICVFESKNLVCLDTSNEFDVNINCVQMLEAVFPQLLSVDSSIERAICPNCRKELTEAYKFKQKCAKTFENIKNYGRSLNQKTDYICKENLNIFRKTRKRKLSIGYNETTSRNILFKIKKLQYGGDVSSSSRHSIYSESFEENLKYELNSPSLPEGNETSTIYLSDVIEQERIAAELKQKEAILDPQIYFEIEQFCMKIENRQIKNDSVEIEDISERSSQTQNSVQDSSSIDDSQQISKASNSEESLVILSSSTECPDQAEGLTQFEDNQEILKRSNSEESLVILSSSTECPDQAESLTKFEDNQEILKRSNSEESLVLLSSTTEDSLSSLESPNQAFSPKVEDSSQIMNDSNSEASVVLLSSAVEGIQNILGSPNQAETVEKFSSTIEDCQQITKGSNSEESLVRLLSKIEEYLVHFSSKVEDSQQISKGSNSEEEESLVLLSSTTENNLNILGSPNQAENLVKVSSKVEDSQQITNVSNSEESLVLLSSAAEGSQNILGSPNQAEILTQSSSTNEDSQQVTKGSNSEECLVLLSSAVEGSQNILGTPNQAEILTQISSTIKDSQQITKGSNSIECVTKFKDDEDIFKCSNQTNLVQSSPTINEDRQKENSVHLTIDTNILECSNLVKSLVQLSSSILDSQNILECQNNTLIRSPSFDDSVEMMDCSDQTESLGLSSTVNKNILVCHNELEDLVQHSQRIEESNNVLGCPNETLLQSTIEDDSAKESHENINEIKNILETSEERLQKYIQSNSYEFFLNETTLSNVISECPNYEEKLKEYSEENCDESSLSSSQIFNRCCKKEENISRPSTRVSHLSDMYDSPNTSEYISDSETDIAFLDWTDTENVLEISADKTDTKPVLIDLVSESTWGPQNVPEPSRENQTDKIEHTSDISGTQLVKLPLQEPRDAQTALVDTSSTQQAPSVKLSSVEPLSESTMSPKNVPEQLNENQTVIIDTSSTQQASSVKLPSPVPLPENVKSPQNVPELSCQPQTAKIDTSSSQKTSPMTLPSLEPLLDSKKSPQNVPELPCEPQTAEIDTSSTQKAPQIKLLSLEPLLDSTISLQNVPELPREPQTANIDTSSTQKAPPMKLPSLEPLLDSTKGPLHETQCAIIDTILDISGTQQVTSMKITSPEVTSKRDTSLKDASKDTSSSDTTPTHTTRETSPKDTSKKDTSSRRTSSRETSRDTSSTRDSKPDLDLQVCPICNKTLNTPYGLKLHIFDKHTKKRHQCTSCPETFTRFKAYKSHFRRMHVMRNQESKIDELRNELDSLTTADRAQDPQMQMFRTSGNYSQARVNNPFLMGPSVLNVNRYRTAGYVPRCRNCGAIFNNHIDFKSHIYSCNERYKEFLNFV